MKKGLCIEVTQGQYYHLYNIMCRQDEIISTLNESDDFDPQTFDNFGFYPYEVEVDGQVYSYGGYWEILEDTRFD